MCYFEISVFVVIFCHNELVHVALPWAEQRPGKESNVRKRQKTELSSVMNLFYILPIVYDILFRWLLKISLQAEFKQTVSLIPFSEILLAPYPH